MPHLKALIIDDDHIDRKRLRRLLEADEVVDEVFEATRADEALAMTGFEPDAVLLDHMLPGQTGLSFLPDLCKKWPRAAVFLMTGQGDENIAVSALKCGATDYISKRVINESSLSRMVQHGVETARMRWKIEQQRDDLAHFSEVLVHDLKAPIRAAAYLVDQIEEDIDDGDMDEVRDSLGLLRKSTDRMQRMIKSLADHVRLDRDQEIEPHSAEDLIDGALTALDLEIAESRARVDVELEPDLPAIPCAGAMVSMVLQNLVANAIKYRGEGAPAIRISVSRFRDAARFEVSDNGVGIPSEYCDTVFLPFKRLPGASGVEGTGLGLSTCRKIVLRHGGSIRCDSEEGVGTTMVFTIPLGLTAALPKAKSA